MRPKALILLICCAGCTDGTTTDTEDTAVDWCNADPYTRWNVLRRGERQEASPEAGTSAYGDEGSNVWWTAATDDEGNADPDLDPFYRDSCPSDCIDWETTGCPCGMVPELDVTLRITQLAYAGRTVFPVFTASDDETQGVTSCVDPEGLGASYQFALEGEPYGQLTVRSSATGQFGIGSSSTVDLRLDLFQSDLTYEGNDWSLGQASIDSIGTNFQGSIVGARGLTEESLDIVSVSATFTAQP